MATVSTSAEREAAWWALHDALPAGWRIGELTFDPAIGHYVLAASSGDPRGRVSRNTGGSPASHQQ